MSKFVNFEVHIINKLSKATIKTLFSCRAANFFIKKTLFSSLFSVVLIRLRRNFEILGFLRNLGEVRSLGEVFTN